MELLVIALAQTLLIAFMQWEHWSERREDARVIEALLQRIQAPAAAVAEYQARDILPSPSPLLYDDDESLWANRDDLAAIMARNAAED